MQKTNDRKDEASMDTQGELQSQQATLLGDKALSQYSTLTSKPKPERCVHFHSHYKPQIYFNNMGTLFRVCKLQPKQCQCHFKGSQRAFDGFLMLSGFGGFPRKGMVSRRL